jgi:hypothetical protein
MLEVKVWGCYVVKILEVRCIKSAVKFVRDDTFHHDIDSECVEAFANELLEMSKFDGLNGEVEAPELTSMVLDVGQT